MRTFILALSAVLATATTASGDIGSFQIRKTDFASLFNHSERAVQPKQVPWAGSYFPYGYHGIADDSQQKPSSSERYDRTFNRGRLVATQWEKANHSCDAVEKELQEGCKNWWGHCNAWAAAAIKEVEPRNAIDHAGTRFSVGDQKAYLTELWMDSDSLFAGETNKSVKTSGWVYEPKSSEARTPLDYGEGSTYDAFWDVTPRSFFHILTNYVGLMGTSVVIDRFTGDEVWNHPVAGYRFLPIRKEDRLAPVTRNGRTLHPVFLRVKLYWTNDGVPASYLSQGFDIRQTGDDERIRRTWPNPEEFEGRILRFTLFLDAPLETNEAGTDVVSAGRVVGEGIWHHQQVKVATPDETHPDFIWLPTILMSGGGNANPHVRASVVGQILRGEPGLEPRRSPRPTDSEGKQPLETEASFSPGTFRSRNPETLSRLITIALAREGVSAEVPSNRVTIGADGSVTAVLSLEQPSDRVASILSEAGLATSSLRPL